MVRGETADHSTIVGRDAARSLKATVSTAGRRESQSGVPHSVLQKRMERQGTHVAVELHDIAHSGERLLDKQKVAGSIPAVLQKHKPCPAPIESSVFPGPSGSRERREPQARSVPSEPRRNPLAGVRCRSIMDTAGGKARA